MNLEQVLKFMAKNLHDIVNTNIYSIFEKWCNSGNDEEFENLIQEINQWKNN